MSILTRIHNFIKDDAYGTMAKCTKKERTIHRNAAYGISLLFDAMGIYATKAALTVAKGKPLTISKGIARAGLWGAAAACVAYGVDYAIQYRNAYNDYKDKPEGKGFMG